MRTQIAPAAGAAAADPEGAMRALMVVVSASFALALLAASSSIPLTWLPGQFTVLCAMLGLAPSAVILAASKRSGMVGLAADDFTLRVGITRWATVGLLVVALPFYQAQGAARTAGALHPLFTIAFAAALCWLVSTVAATLARAWATLKVQDWEIAKPKQLNGSAVDLETAGRVNRGVILRDLWRAWMVGEVTLAGALLLSSQLAHGHQIAATLGLGALVIFTLGGLVLLNQAARARQMVQWRLSDVSVSEELAQTWNGAGLRVALGAVAGIGFLLLIHGVDVAHTTVQWTAQTIVVPLLNPLLQWLRRAGNGYISSCTDSSSCGGSPGPRSLPPPIHVAPTRQRPAGKLDFSWFQQVWPEALILLLLCFTAYAYWRTRGNDLSRGFWRELLTILFRDLRTLLLLLGRPTKRLFWSIADRGREIVSNRATRPRRREKPAWTTPRQVIVGLYLGALSFAARRGVPRRPGQTPREYADQLSALLPGSNGVVSKMTDMFVSARYADQPVGEDWVSAMQGLWKAFRSLWSQRSK